MKFHKKTKQLLEAYAKVMRELRNEGIVRSSNNPVGDIAEAVACEVLNLKRAPKNARGYDAIGEKGTRYEVKSRRHTEENSTSLMGAIRDLDKKQFDYLVVVIFGENFEVKNICVVPHVVVEKYAKYREYTRSNILNFSGAILKDKRIKQYK